MNFRRRWPSAPTRQLWLVPGQTGEPGEWHQHFVDFQRDQTVADVLRSTGAGMRSVEHVKRYTSISTANDQGKTSGVNAIGVIAAALKYGGADAAPASAKSALRLTVRRSHPWPSLPWPAASAANCSTPPA